MRPGKWVLWKKPGRWSGELVGLVKACCKCCCHSGWGVDSFLLGSGALPWRRGASTQERLMLGISSAAYRVCGQQMAWQPLRVNCWLPSCPGKSWSRRQDSKGCQGPFCLFWPSRRGCHLYFSCRREWPSLGPAECIDYFSVAKIETRDQGSLQKRVYLDWQAGKGGSKWQTCDWSRKLRAHTLIGKH